VEILTQQNNFFRGILILRCVKIYTLAAAAAAPQLQAIIRMMTSLRTAAVRP